MTTEYGADKNLCWGRYIKQSQFILLLTRDLRTLSLLMLVHVDIGQKNVFYLVQRYQTSKS